MARAPWRVAVGTRAASQPLPQARPEARSPALCQALLRILPWTLLAFGGASIAQAQVALQQPVQSVRTQGAADDAAQTRLRAQPAANAQPRAGARPATARVAPADEFTYRTRAGDTLIGIAARLLREPRRWPELQARNRIVDPRRMPRGTALRIPYDWLRLTPQSARVLERVGAVTVDGRGLAVGDTVEVGAAIETAADGSATLELVDGSILVLKPASRLRLERLQRVDGAAADEAVIELERGKLETQVKPRGDMGRFEIRTPAAVSAVRGTLFRAGYAADAALGTTETLGGAVAVSGAGAAVTVGAGFGTSAAPGQAPRAPVPLLPAPRLDTLPALNDGAQLRWTFAAVPGAAAYRVQLARDADFRSLLAERVTPDPAATLDAPADGRYWLRARAIDAGGIEGFDATHGFEQRRRLDAPTALAPGDGAKRLGATTRFEWAAVPAAVGYRFQLARDTGFGTLVAEREVSVGTRAGAGANAGTVGSAVPQAGTTTGTAVAAGGDAGAAPLHLELERLEPGSHAWRVAAIDANGRDGQWSAPQSFTQKPPPVAIEPLAAAAPVANGVAGAAPTHEFRWRATEPGQRFEWQLARRADFTRLARSGDSDSTTLSLTGLAPGRHWLRVRAIDADGFESPYGPAYAFDVPYPRWLPYLTGAILLIPLL